MKNAIPIIIPSLEPDSRLPQLVDELLLESLTPIIIVDDGSGQGYLGIFDSLSEKGCTVLRHDTNRGKGRALKTAFEYCLDTYPDMIGCVTADSDGQHSPECIKKCREALTENPASLILGVRDFSGEDVPPKSRFGNNLTKKICKTICGVSVSDTQTGLRGIPSAFMRELLSLEGEHFEFETRMLIATKGKYPIAEVPIKTIYDSRENHSTHFNPIKDSVRIYSIFFGELVKFLVSSVSSCVIDLALFWLFCRMLDGGGESKADVMAAGALARVISATYNYLINYAVVFKSKGSHKKTALRYFCLAAVQLCISTGAVTGILHLLPFLPELAVKIPVDLTLFFVSYLIQRKFVYGKR